MLKTLKLILPVIVPSWNFFDDVTASPRLEIAILNSSQDKGEDWQAFYQKPISLSALDLLKRLFWNPQWNQFLWSVSCIEKFMMSDDQIQRREIQVKIIEYVRAEIIRRQICSHSFFKFRLVLVDRKNAQTEKLKREIVFTSTLYAVEKNEAGR